MAQAPPIPVAPQERPRSSGPRVQALDAARAAAIVGMIAVNVGPRKSDGSVLALVYGLPVGRASLLFMLLAGIGMSLLSRTARKPGGKLPWKIVLWRAVLLLGAGLALQIMHHQVSVILPTYGLLFLLSLPLLKASTPALAWTAGIVFAVGPPIWIATQVASGETYRFIAPTLLDTPIDILRGTVLSGSYPVVVWAAPFLAGLLLGRADLRNRTLHQRLVLWGAVAGVGGYLLSRLLILAFGEPGRRMGWDHLVSAVDHSQMPLWLVSGVGSALFVLGLFLLAEDVVARRLGALAAAGRLSLTIYVGHLVVLAALVRPEPHYLHEGVFITASLSVGAVVFARLWTKRFSTGPLEYLLRIPEPFPRAPHTRAAP
ncbi:hypothetical protein NCCP1664_16300 [Zafaria cholistanensis]|uniref:DUF418 domain-containing protein n=1 Tax=Zafaria cholistanensis TaxID=1682741 RepID=A0A5A7NQB8_9MICC|nr:DUF418 domain-containing protein [Zafaria cholistanensis]GER23134.1 hypothetical protein NCCP1664_16300 [Zafaria cholistanensis]